MGMWLLLQSGWKELWEWVSLFSLSLLPTFIGIKETNTFFLGEDRVPPLRHIVVVFLFFLQTVCVLSGSQEDRRFKTHSGSSFHEPTHPPQNILHFKYTESAGSTANRQWVYNY